MYIYIYMGIKEYLRHVSVPLRHLQGAQYSMFRTCYQSVVGFVIVSFI